jgi:hypothetical protein
MSASADPQLKPSYSAPSKCPKGCARWDNLAADGNTRNQQEVNQKWQGGSPPAGAGNQCAQPANDPSTGPWCYCAGTNDGSWGLCEDRNAEAAVCRSTPNGLQDLATQINNCTSTTEITRNKQFAGHALKLNKDIESLQALVADSLVMGDNIFGKAGPAEIAKQIQARHKELVVKKEHLKKEIDKKEAIVERSNRDFEDVKERIPDPQPKKVLNVLEDYTMAFLVISYLFMILAGIYVFTSIADLKLIAFFKALGGSVFLTIFMFMVMYYFT